MELSHTLVRIPLARASKRPLIYQWSTLPPDSPLWADTFAEHPGCNVGIRLDGLLVVDCDSPAAVEWWLGKHVPTQFQSRGREERRSFWYRYDGDAIRPGKLRHDVDLKCGPGHQVVVPPSTHPTGRAYEWLVPEPTVAGTRQFFAVDESWWRYIPEVSEDMLVEMRSARSGGPESGGWDVVEAGGRDDFLTAVAGLLRARGMGEAGMAAALAGVNQAVCHPPKSAADIKRIAHSVSRYDAGQSFNFELLPEWDG